MSRERELIGGIHAVRKVLETAPERVLELWIRSDGGERLQEIAQLAAAHGIAVQPVPGRTLDRLLPHTRHQGVVARRQAAPRLEESDLVEAIRRLRRPLLLVLDGVEDPHNLGACLRTADAAGVDGMVVPASRGTGITAAVARVAAGAAESVPLYQVANLARALRAMKQEGVWLIGTSDRATQGLYETDLSVPLALVLGTEGRGLRRLTAEQCDLLVSIPMHGTVESLNVSVAAGVCLYEALRQREGVRSEE